MSVLETEAECRLGWAEQTGLTGDSRLRAHSARCVLMHGWTVIQTVRSSWRNIILMACSNYISGLENT